MNYHDGVLMKKTKRVIDDKNMYILGNCEIVAKGRKISLKRSNKKKLFEGSLSDNGWEAENVFIYSLK